MELVILVGLPAAGKSTFYRQYFVATYALVSKDLLGERNKGRQQEAQLREAMAAGQSVVVDNTNPTVVDRAALMALGREYGATVDCYYLRSTVAASLARNRQREGRARVPDVAVYASAKRLVPPTYAEGFDHLYEVAISDDGGFSITEMAR